MMEVMPQTAAAAPSPLNPAVPRAICVQTGWAVLSVFGIIVAWILLTIDTSLPVAIGWLFGVVLCVQLLDAVCRGLLVLYLKRPPADGSVGDPPADGSVGDPPADGSHVGEWVVICCSGGGIKSASFCLGALQRLNEEGIYDNAKQLVAVSGGGYAAAAFSLAPSDPQSNLIFSLDSRALRGLRQRTDYLFDSARTQYELVLSLGFGIAVNLIAVISAVFVVVTIVCEWVNVSGHIVQGGTPMWELSIDWGWNHLLAPLGLPVILLILLFLVFLIDHARWPEKGNIRLWSSRAPKGFWSQAPTTMVSVAGAWILAFPLLILVAYWEHTMDVHAFSAPSDVPAWIKWVVSSGLFMVAVNWVRTGLAKPPSTGFWGVLAMQIRMNVLPRVLIVLAALAVYLMAAWILNVLLSVPSDHWLRGAWALSLAVVCLIGFRFLGSANITSLHPFYRDRLAWAFLYQECRDNPDGSTHAKEHGTHAKGNCTARVPPSKLTFDSIKRKAELMLCATANLQEHELVPTGRNGTSFVISAQGTGLTDKYLSADGHYCPSESQHLRYLGSAMAISGAAIAPLVGRDSRQVGPFRVLLTLANIRLGVWQPNPLWKRLDDSPGVPRWLSRANRLLNQATPAHVLIEAAGRPGLGDPNLYLTDGGHYDNLGLVEALRMRPTRVIVLDGSGDPPDQFPTMGRAIATARMDLGVEVTEFDPTPLLSGRGQHLPTTAVVEAVAKWPDNTHSCRIDYVRCVLPAESSWDLRAYQATHAAFPATSDTLEAFSEFDFEAFRQLGYTAAGHIRGPRNDLAPA